jgi:hypothetical protein
MIFNMLGIGTWLGDEILCDNNSGLIGTCCIASFMGSALQ